MTATNHALTGALVGILISQPMLAIPLAFLIHFAMDAIPHFGLNIQDINSRNNNKVFRLVLVVDVIISGFLLILLPIILSPTYTGWVIFVCMLACMSPDLVWGWRFYFELKTKKIRIKNWFSRFHAKIQWSETVPGALVELVWFFGILSLINYST